MADDSAQRGGQLSANLLALVGFEEVEDAADRLRGVLRVQGGEHQVAGVCCADRRLERDRVAHFAYHDDVGILTQDVLQARLEAAGVETDFALLDDGLVVLEDEFDGIFQCDDVLFEVGVDVLEHRRQRGGLAGTRRAGDQDDTAGGSSDGLDDGHEAQFLEARDLRLHIAHGQGERTALLEHVGPETSHAGLVVAEVDFAFFIHATAGMRRNHRSQDLVHPLLGGHRCVDGDELPADAENDRGTHFDVNIGGSTFNRSLQDSAQQICVVAHGFCVAKA